MVAPTRGTVDDVGADIIRPVILEHKITSPPGDNAVESGKWKVESGESPVLEKGGGFLPSPSSLCIITAPKGRGKTRLAPRGRQIAAPTRGTVDVVGADIIRPVILPKAKSHRRKAIIG